MDFDDLEELLIIAIELDACMKKNVVLTSDLDKVYRDLSTLREHLTKVETNLQTQQLLTGIFIGTTALGVLGTILGIALR